MLCKAFARLSRLAAQGWLRDLVGPRSARAEDVAPSVSQFLEEYRRAVEGKDLTGLARFYASFPAEQQDALTAYFASVRDLRVRLDGVETAIVGEEAVVTYTRTDDFVDVLTGHPQHASTRVTKRLRQVDGRWRFTAGK